MDIKLFVCCHKPVNVPKHPLLVPLQVGAALAGEHFPGFLHDDAGDSISEKNRSYCELTGQYWAWKNVEADYYGFFHYRRYLYPNEAARLPYIIEGEPTLQMLDRLGYERFAELIQKWDVVFPKGENMHIPVREHYASAPFHHVEDLNLAEQILAGRFPEYSDGAKGYLANTICYFGNIFVMKKQVFQEYCEWLFPILEEFDRQKDVSGYCAQERRVDGYLAERLLGIYRAYHQELRVLELPRVHFVEKPVERCGKQVVNMMLPPGSRRRAEIKFWKKWIGRKLYG